VKLELTESVTGALACLTASPRAAFVCRADQLNQPLRMLIIFLVAGCWAVWCPCVVYSKNKQRLQNLQNQDAPLSTGGERYNADCCVYACLAIPGYGWVLQVC
jgi:hypothetical protein